MQSRYAVPVVQKSAQRCEKKGDSSGTRRNVGRSERPNADEGVHESVWQLCCLGEFLVISMMHLHSSEVVARCGLDFLCAGYFQRGLSRHMRVRFNAVVARANSAATFPSPRIRNLRIPRCSFKIPMTGSAMAFRRLYNARPVVQANVLRMRRRGG